MQIHKLLFLSGILAITCATQAWAQVPVCIDAGHGGTDSGATGCNLIESEINLNVALKLQPMLEAAGFTVYMTRTTDTAVDLSARSAYANSKGVSTFASIHTNSAGENSTATGIETFCYTGCTGKTSGNNYQQADQIQTEMLNVWNLTNRGVKAANYSVLRNTNMPATLTELGFIGNCSNDATYLSSETHLQEAAEAHCKALVTKWGGDSTQCTQSSSGNTTTKTGIVKGGTYKTTTSGEWLGEVNIQIGDKSTVSSSTPNTLWELTVPEGNYTLTASKSGYNTATRNDCEPASADKISWCSIALTETNAQKGTAVGTVQDSSNGQTIPANILINGQQAFTYDGTGQWSYELDAGAYGITALADGYNKKTIFCIIFSNATSECSISLDPQNGTIIGKVLDTATNQPVSAQVALGNRTQDYDTQSDFVFSVPAGSYTLTASAEGYETGSTSCQVNRGQISTCNIAISEPDANIQKGFIKGQLLNSRTNQPIAGTILLSDSSVFHYTGNAQYQFYVPAGIYQVTGMAEGYDTQTVSCTSTPGQTTTCDISLNPQTGTLTGYVYQAGDIMTRIKSTITVDGTTLSYDGEQNWTKIVEPGVYSVTALTKYGETGQNTCTVEPGKTTSCNIAIVVATDDTRYGTMTGVVARNGMTNMFIPAQVSIDGLETVSYHGQDDEVWTFDHLPEGSYRVSAVSPGYYDNYVTCRVVADEVSRCIILLTPIINDDIDDPDVPVPPASPDPINPPVTPSNPDTPETPSEPETPDNQPYATPGNSEDSCSATPNQPASSPFGILATFGGLLIGLRLRRRFLQGAKR